jgi:chromosome segregation ATPase
MNRAEKEEYVIRLYKENRSTREIAKLMHMSFRDIGIIIKKVKPAADGESGLLEEDDDIKSKSKTTQAIKLFSELNTPVEVAVALDLPADQVQAIYQEYWELDGMCRLAQIYEEAKYDLHELLRLHRTVKGLGMEKRDIISVFDLIKHNQLETLQWKAGYLRSEINTLEWKKRNSTYHLSNLERTINEYEETLAQKRAEMAYLNRETRKLRQRIIDYNSHNLRPVEHSEHDSNSDSTQIVPYNKERILAQT